jgi:hypothetical protein
MIEASTPRLPDHPTPEQLDAWIELAELVSDPSFVENLRASAKEVWDRKIDMNALRIANETAAKAASETRARGLSPTSTEAGEMIEQFVQAVAKASGNEADAKMRKGVRDRFLNHDPRASRYWELIAIMSGRPAPVGNVDDWRFIAEAVKHHLA